MHLTLNEPFLAWANLLHSRNDMPGTYTEAKWKREAALVRFDFLPLKHREAQLRMSVMNAIAWPPWYGSDGYVLFGVWLDKEGGEPIMSFTGTPSPYPFRLYRGANADLRPAAHG